MKHKLIKGIIYDETELQNSVEKSVSEIGSKHINSDTLCCLAKELSNQSGIPYDQTLLQMSTMNDICAITGADVHATNDPSKMPTSNYVIPKKCIHPTLRDELEKVDIGKRIIGSYIECQNQFINEKYLDNEFEEEETISIGQKEKGLIEKFVDGVSKTLPNQAELEFPVGNGKTIIIKATRINDN